MHTIEWIVALWFLSFPPAIVVCRFMLAGAR